MPLSEHEQRVLEQMERALYAEDPRLASTLKTPQHRPVDRRRLAVGILGAVAGLALVVTGVMTQLIWIGAIGFLLMVVGAAWAATPGRGGARLHVVGGDGKAAARPRPTGQRRPRTPKAPGTFMQRQQEQWDRRKEQGPF